MLNRAFDVCWDRRGSIILTASCTATLQTAALSILLPLHLLHCTQLYSPSRLATGRRWVWREFGANWPTNQRPRFKMPSAQRPWPQSKTNQNTKPQFDGWFDVKDRENGNKTATKCKRRLYKCVLCGTDVSPSTAEGRRRRRALHTEAGHALHAFNAAV